MKYRFPTAELLCDYAPDSGKLGLKEVMNEESKGDIALAIGKKTSGESYCDDLATMPNLLIAENVNGGRTVCLNVILTNILFRYSPEEVQLILMDLDRGMFDPYNGLPHMLFENAVGDPGRILNVFRFLCKTVEDRMGLLLSSNAADIKEYNALSESKKLPRYVVVFNDLYRMMKDPAMGWEFEKRLIYITGRAAQTGIHLIVSTQSPTPDVLTQAIVNSFDTKFGFRVMDDRSSDLVISSAAMADLRGKGDFYAIKGAEKFRCQCAYVSDEEVDAVTGFIRENNKGTFKKRLIASVLEKEASDLSLNNEKEEKCYWDMMKTCYQKGEVSCSYLQRRFGKGYNFVCNVIEYWEKRKFITPPDGQKQRKICCPESVFNALYLTKYGGAVD